MIIHKILSITLLGMAVTQSVQSQQNSEIDVLQDQVKQLQQQLEVLADALENQAATTTETKTSIWDQFNLGSYGELHYNNLSADDSAFDLEEIDFHRFVLMLGYDFSESIRFVSEIELEHALVKDTADGSNGGEVELEQAYIEFDHNIHAATQVGVFLLPIGILNETHEPTTFYGVERNEVESIIIPSTWWEAGAQYIQRFGQGWQWNIALHSGLAMPVDGSSAFRIRSGRQKISNAAASDPAVTTRLKYNGIAGLEIAAALQYQADASQTTDDGLDEGILFSTHLIYQWRQFALRALYADWSFAGDTVKAAAVDSQSGWYIEPSYKLTKKVGIYLRYSDVEAAREQDRFNQWELGANWWPHEQVVLKIDWREREHDLSNQKGRDFGGLDLGVGYFF